MINIAIVNLRRRKKQVATFVSKIFSAAVPTKSKILFTLYNDVAFIDIPIGHSFIHLFFPHFHFLQLLEEIGKSRHGATSSYQSMDAQVRSPFFPLSDNKNDEDKENQCSKGSSYRTKSLIESSDDDFDHCESPSRCCCIPRPSFQCH